jgi:hypothetical protein
MASSLSRFEPVSARPPLSLDADLTRMVSELTRDVERFDSLVDSQRQLLQKRTGDGAKAERQWRQIRARAGTITTRVHAILHEIDLPVADN